MSAPLERQSAAAIGRAIAAGTLHPVEAADFFLERIGRARANPVFITLTPERARREAEASARRRAEGRPRGPLDGVPFAWKDLVDLAGTPTTTGSALFRDATPAQRDAPIAQALAEAGMVALGKTNLSEFAFSGLGLNPHFGTPVNPHDTRTPRIPGGSSSGSAVAVAAGLAPCAIGSDTGGSIRNPASFNGIVGFKTSEGRIDRKGVFPLSRTLDTIGPLARSVEDCVLIDMALRGAVASPVRRAELAGVTILVHDAVPSGLDSDVAANMEGAAALLSAAGARVMRRALPVIDEARAVTAKHGALVTAEAYAEQRAHYESADAQRMDRRVVARALLGRAIAGHDLIAIQRERERLIGLLEAELGDALLLTPATPVTAPAIAPLDADDDLFRRTNLHVLHYCVIGNYFRMCGLALPSGRDRGGMPTGIQFLARGGDDERLLSLGLAIERVLAEG